MMTAAGRASGRRRQRRSGGFNLNPNDKYPPLPLPATINVALQLLVVTAAAPGCKSAKPLRDYYDVRLESSRISEGSWKTFFRLLKGQWSGMPRR